MEYWSDGFRQIIFGRLLFLLNTPVFQHSIPPETVAIKKLYDLPGAFGGIEIPRHLIKNWVFEL